MSVKLSIGTATTTRILPCETPRRAEMKRVLSVARQPRLGQSAPISADHLFWNHLHRTFDRIGAT